MGAMNERLRISGQDSKEQIARELQVIRQNSLIAARRGDYKKMALLTRTVVRLSEIASMNVPRPEEAALS